jgi:tetratricopeptide (TPR) repeat protein
MQSHTRLLIAAAAASLLFSAHGVVLAQATPSASAQQSPAVIAALLQQGRYWQIRQPERASEAWKKLLAVQPGNAEALSGLGRVALDAKKPAEARGYLDQLRAAHPGSVELVELEQAIDIASSTGQADLDDARILLRQKRMEEAAQKYKTLFKGREPQGRLGVEYYSVLGYTATGREEALAGLRRLQRADPNNSQIPVTIASLQLHSLDTRLNAMRSLAALSKRQDVGGEAAEHLRDSLGWLGSPPPAAYASLFREYLAANPDDTELREQLAGRGTKLPGQGVPQVRNARGGRTAGTGAPRTNAGTAVAQAPRKIAPQALYTTDGYAEIQNKAYEKADADFAAALKIDPNFADAVGGMALLRFRQQRFAESRRYAQEAFRLDGQQGWKILLDTVSYWELLQQAQVLIDARRFEEAEAILKQAKAIKLEEADNNADNRLAGVYVEQKRFAEAERVYREVLAGTPDDQLAMTGLISLLASTDRAAQAQALIDNLKPEARAALDLDRLRANLAIGEGRAALKRGQEIAAREKFSAAVDLQPENPWMRLELARAELRSGTRTSASKTMESLLDRHPDDSDTIYTTALFRGTVRDWPGVVELLDRVPPGRRTVAMATLQRSAAIHVQTDQALALAHDGRRSDANALLEQASTRVGEDADLLGTIAQGYVDLGELERARLLLRGAVERSARDPANAAATTALQIRYGTVLLASGDDRNLGELLQQIELRSQAGQIGSADMGDVEELRRAYVVRQAEGLRNEARPAEAQELIRPLLAQTPEDPVLLGLLARIYNDIGQKQQASALYRDILARNPDDVGSLTAASGLATLQRDFRTADEYLTRAEALAPQDPDVLASRGRLHRAEGRPRQAVIYLRRAADALRARDPVLSGLRSSVSGPSLAAVPRAATESNASLYARPIRSFEMPESTGSALNPARQAR